MTNPPPHHSTRALTVLALTPALLAGIALVGPASPATATTSDTRPGNSDRIQAGGWQTAAVARTRLQVKDQRVSVRVTRGTGLKVARIDPVRVDASTRYRWRVRVKSTGKAVRAHLRVADRGTKINATTLRLRPGRWQTLTVKTKATAGQSLRARVSVPGAKRGTRILLRGYRVTHPGAPKKSGAGSSALTKPENCRINKRGLPSCGAFLGQAIGGNESPAATEQRVGRLGTRRTYWRATQVDSAVATAAADLKAGRLPWISFKMPGSWAAVADGRHDAWLKEIHTKLDALNGPVWIAFHHEPEGDEADITQWRRMQEHIGPIVRGGSDNIAFTAILTGWNQFYGDSAYSLANIWPRNIKVDVAGFDIYQSLGSVRSNGTVNTKGEDTDSYYFKKVAAWAEKEGVAWGLAETGYTDYAAGKDPRWLSRTFQQLVSRGGISFTYFNSPLNNGGSSWSLNETKTAEYARTAPAGITLGR